MMPIPPNLEQQIRQVLRDCGLQAEQMAKKGFEVSQKGPEDYVTSIDAALDRQLLTAFSLLFPEDGVITEENAESRRQFQADYARLWCIDPLDGTEEFIQKQREYAVMVGLLQDYQPIAGWIYSPTEAVLYYGGPTWGLFQTLADQPPTALLPVPAPVPSPTCCPIIIGHRDQTRYGAAIARQIPAAQFYCLGSFGLKVMEVVLGRAGLYLYFNGRVKLWDTTGPLALAQTAGLVCCDLEGNSIGFSPATVDSGTLVHHQPIIVGWHHYVEQFLPRIRQAVEGERG
jgi:3'(2'), 5'-bisphosphate nucleotidase